MSTNAEQTQRLGHAVLSRRRQLGLNQLEVWQRGGPSNTTLTKIENGRQDTLSNATAKRLDRGLSWEAGSAMAIWVDGREPVAIPGTVGGSTQDADSGKQGHVNAPGERVEAGITNEDLLREILRGRAEYDQLRAEVRETNTNVEVLSATVDAVSQRVARLEQRGS